MICWLLLTTVATTTLVEAWERIRWYACRWVAEMFHKVLKSSCRVEWRQFDELDTLERYLAMDSIAAWRVLYLTMQRRETPELPCTALLEASEWQALYMFTYKTCRPPSVPPTLGQTLLWIAKLGGYADHRKTAHPGTIVVWRGLQRLYDIAEVWRLFNFLDQI